LERERLTTLGGLAAMSLDALSSVAYGPEAILVVLVTAGAAAIRSALPITAAIVVLLTALVISYRQVIEAFPDGGGAYAVSKTHLGTTASLVAAASLIVDYVLNAAVGVSAGVEALTAAFPSLLFVAAILMVIVAGLVRSHPAVPLSRTLPPVTDTVGTLLILKAFASGCSALTGVEAIANSVPQFRVPRVRRAQYTEIWLGVLLGVMLLGIGGVIHKFNVVPQSGTTVLAQLTAAGVGHGFLFYAVQMITLVLLALAANTSFGGLPVLAGLLARDNFLPHLFALRADRRVFRYGITVLAVAAAALLVASRGDTQALVPLFAVGVFVGFTLSQVGMVRHWYLDRTANPRGWLRRAVINGIGAVLTAAATVIELVSKFTSGAWLIALVIPLLVLMFWQVNRVYTRIGALLEIGKVPPPPVRTSVLVVVPVAGMSRLTAEAINAALSLGDEVIAVTVVFVDPDDESADAHFREEWQEWHPDVPQVSLRSEHRSLGPPLVQYLKGIEAQDKYHRLVVLIPEVQPARPWLSLLHNQRGGVLERAIRRGTSNVVLCRLRFRLTTLVQ
jgi:hypothetical protein